MYDLTDFIIHETSTRNKYRKGYTKGYKDGYAKAITEFAEKLKETEEGYFNNSDIVQECKKCMVWRIAEINEIATELKGE